MNPSPTPAPPPEPASTSSGDTLREILRTVLAQAGAARAEAVTNAFEQAGKTIGKLTGVSGSSIVARLQEEAGALSEGRLDSVEGRLAAQAITLDTLFHHLTQYAHQGAMSMDAYAGYLKLALRAQAQSAHALAALAEIKQGPKVIMTRQLNAAQQQIINNGSNPPARSGRGITRARKPQTLSEPSPLQQYAQMDTRIPQEAKPAYPEMDPMEQIDRPAHRVGQETQ